MKKLVLGFSSVILVMAIASHLIGHSLLKISDIEVVAGENQPLDSYAFNKLQKNLSDKLQVYKSRWLWQVPLDEILLKARSDRRVMSAHVTRIFPNQLRVVLEPYKPILVYISPEGLSYPVSNDASLLNPVAQKEIPDVPILRGAAFMKNPLLRAKAVALVEELPLNGFFSRGEISEINYSNKEGFALILNKEAMRVVIGDNELGPKAGRVEKVLNYIYSQQLKGRVIDARFNKKIVVRMRNAP